MSSAWLRGGPPAHPLVYSKRIARTEGRISDGEVVEVKTREGRACGYGFWHGQSMIALRVLTYDPAEVPDETWLRGRIRSANRLRTDVLRLAERTSAWRVVHGEGDGLSGLVVDRYGRVASVTLYSLGWHRRREELQRVLLEELDVDEVVVRVDPKASIHEDMALPEPPPLEAVEIEEDGVRFAVDATGGHKTGFFLDQRDNRRWLGQLARGRAVFDGMTYTGGFALAAAHGGAASVRAMDLDEQAIARASENARLNGLCVDFAHGDVFNALRAYAALPEGDRPEVVVVDPPKWARDRAGLGVALQRYRDLNRLALQAVRPEGLVFTHSCSGLVSPETFRGVVQDAARDTRREVRVLFEGGAAPDHPVSATTPESRYLKSMLLHVGREGSGPGAPERPPEAEDPRGRDRGRDRGFDRGPDRRPDRRPDRGADRGPDRGADRGPDRGRPRGGERGGGREAMGSRRPDDRRRDGGERRPREGGGGRR